MENGMQKTSQEYTQTTSQKQTCGASERLASRLVLQENEKEWTAKADSSEKSSAYLMNSKKKINPNGWSMKTLKECLVQMADGIMPQSSLKWTGGGYDIEWQNINSAWYVPQNRERIFTVGHLRRYGSAKIFPVEGADGENSVQIIGHSVNYRRNRQVFSPDGITETLDTATGGAEDIMSHCRASQI